MVRLDHLEIPVADYLRTRDWYRDMLGFTVEMEFADGNTVGMRDDADLTVFFHQGGPPAPATGLSFTIQVTDVDAKFAELTARGVTFEHGPQRVYWGYGAELLDPDGYRLRLWDETTMKTKGGGA